MLCDRCQTTSITNGISVSYMLFNTQDQMFKKNLSFRKLLYSLYFLPFIPSIQAPCPLSLTSSKQHTSIILILSSSQTSPTFPLTLPKFYIQTCTPNLQSGLHHTASNACLLQGVGVPALLLMVGRCRPPQPSG